MHDTTGSANPEAEYKAREKRIDDALALKRKGKTIGIFQSGDIFRVKEIVGDTTCIIGGLPVSMPGSSTETEARKYPHRLCEEVGKGGGYIMSSSVMELEGCNAGLIKTWTDAAREYGKY